MIDTLILLFMLGLGLFCTWKAGYHHGKAEVWEEVLERDKKTYRDIRHIMARPTELEDTDRLK